MSGGTRWAALASAAAVLLALLAATPAAHGADGEVEVRVAAQRLADGRTEFALQERQANGEWGERRLPRGRFFPAGTRVGRWLGSSPLTLELSPDSMSAAAGDSGLEVRVAAQLLADGRMEFALQERQADGSWGERRLPRGRFFPANPRVGRWLASSPLTVSVPGAVTPGGTATPTPSATECSAETTAARVTASIALVRTSQGRGTAFYIGDSEWVTAEHVVTGATSVRLSNAAMDVTATVTGVRADVDLAVLAAGTSAAALSWGETPRTGADALVIGYGAGQRTLVAGMTEGIVSEGYAENGQTYIRTSAPANPGNSGGPLLDICGNVIGVIQSKLVDEAVEGVAYAIAADSVRALLPSVRAGSPTAPSTPTTLEITAFCNAPPDQEGWNSSEECAESGANGIVINRDVEWWAIGVDDWDNARYSIDGTAVVTEAELTLEGLAPGEHTVHIIEQQAAGWTEWSQPYRFEIRDRVATLVITAFCNGDLDTAADCLTAATSGLVADERLSAWVSGVEDFDNVRYSIDGWAGVTWADLTLGDLAPGPHTLEVIEWQSSGWTEWSVPYTFTVRGVPAWLEIATFCTGSWDTDAACRAAAANGLDADENWQVWVSGVEDFDNVYYSLNGGDAVAHADMTLLGLVPGRHTIQAIEQQPAGWTGWSEPYWFTIRR